MVQDMFDREFYLGVYEVHHEEDNTNVCAKIVFLMLKYELKFPSFLCLVLIFNRNNILLNE